jgi:signal transduction histidine kinase
MKQSQANAEMILNNFYKAEEYAYSKDAVIKLSCFMELNRLNYYSYPLESEGFLIFSKESYLQRITELEQENQKLLQQNRNKNELLAAISHDLRNPLGALINFALILKQELRESKIEEAIEYSADIQAISEEMLSLVEDILDVSQLNSGKFSVDTTNKIDLKNVINRSVTLTKVLAKKRFIEITSNLPAKLPLINLDCKRMKQIIVNLLSNAIKYSDEETTVNISANLITTLNQQQKIMLVVSDQGFGMDEDEIELALQKYKSINNKNTGKVDSFGLGLPIVVQLVEAQGGKVKIESKKNVGTKVILEFVV